MTDSRDAVPLLSVIIPTYNYAAMLPRALSSVLSQMDRRTELIVVDDGSTDDTAQILATLSTPATLSCRFVRQDNAGPAAARNHGLRLSRGRFLLFLDADDELLPGALEAVLQALQPAGERHGEPGLLLGTHIAVYPDGREKLDQATAVSGAPEQRVAAYLFDKRISVCHGASVFRRDLLEQRPYPEHIRQGEDKPVFAYMIANADAVTVAVPLVRIHKHPGSLRRNAELAQLSREALLEAIFEKLPADCQALKPRYAAGQYLSVFRNCYRAGLRHAARDYYRQAWRADWRQALQWSYLSKYLRLLLSPAKRNQNS